MHEPINTDSITIFRDGQQSTIEACLGGILIGRDPMSHFPIADDEGVSWSHGTFEVTPKYGVWVYVDHSKNGTILNDSTRLASDACVVRNGDILRIGDTDIKVKFDRCGTEQSDGSCEKALKRTVRGMGARRRSAPNLHLHYTTSDTMETRKHLRDQASPSVQPVKHSGNSRIKKKVATPLVITKDLRSQDSTHHPHLQYSSSPVSSTALRKRATKHGSENKGCIQQDNLRVVTSKRRMQDKKGAQRVLSIGSTPMLTATHSPIPYQKIRSQQEMLRQKQRVVQEEEEYFINETDRYFNQRNEVGKSVSTVSDFDTPFNAAPERIRGRPTLAHDANFPDVPERHHSMLLSSCSSPGESKCSSTRSSASTVVAILGSSLTPVTSPEPYYREEVLDVPEAALAKMVLRRTRYTDDDQWSAKVSTPRFSEALERGFIRSSLGDERAELVKLS